MNYPARGLRLGLISTRKLDKQSTVIDARDDWEHSSGNNVAAAEGMSCWARKLLQWTPQHNNLFRCYVTLA